MPPHPGRSVFMKRGIAYNAKYKTFKSVGLRYNQIKKPPLNQRFLDPNQVSDTVNQFITGARACLF
jgi:hypothetical protein